MIARQWELPQLDSAVADCGVVGLDDIIFRRTNFPLDELPPDEMVTL